MISLTRWPKVRTVNAWHSSFDFLGYTFCKRYQHGSGKVFLAPTPSKKNVNKYREKIRQETASDQTWKKAEVVAQKLNQITRGFWNYFCQGAASNLRYDLDGYVWTRMKDWAFRKHVKLKNVAQRYRKAEAATALLVLGRTIPQRQCW